jgi:hypothetical protein
MAYIGTSPSNGVRRRFVYEATASQTSFSGSDENGVTLTYVDSLYLDVFQNGIKLKAGDDYTATTGTSVVLVQGASANDVVEMVAFDVFSVGDTVSAKDGGNFAGTVGFGAGIASPVTINGATPTLTIGDAGAEDAKIVFDGNAQDFHIGLDDSTDSLTIGLGSALGTTTSMAIDANGIITKPLQPAFSVHKNGTNQNNITANDAFYTITWSTERFDQNADFSSNTFTAPVTGKYFLQLHVRLNDIDSAAGYYIFSINTTLKNYRFIFDPDFVADPIYWSITTSVLADMDANDTVTVSILQQTGTAQTDIDGNAEYTFFTGYLVA